MHICANGLKSSKLCKSIFQKVEIPWRKEERWKQECKLLSKGTLVFVRNIHFWFGRPAVVMETPFCSEAFKDNECLSGKKEQSTCSIPLIWGDVACKHVTFSSYSLCKLAVLVTGLLCVLNPWRGNTQQAQTLSTFGYIHAEKFSVGLSKVHSNIRAHQRPFRNKPWSREVKLYVECGVLCEIGAFSCRNVLTAMRQVPSKKKSL